MTAASAIAWEFRRRHRYGLLAIGGGLVALAITRVVVMWRGAPPTIDNELTFAFAVNLPLTSSFLYFLAMFTHGVDGDLAARQSMYPARMFTRPVSTTALAAWPMLFGAVSVTLLWAAVRAIALMPAFFHVPVVWPAVLAVSHIMWTQALMWMPYGLRGMRVFVVILWLINIDTVVLLALHFRAGEATMTAILLPTIPLAFLVARYALSRARRGDVPDWTLSALGSRLSALGFAASRKLRAESREPAFTSAASAQAWFEWRRNGKPLPVWVAIILPFELLLLWIAGTSTGLVLVIILGAMLVPIVMATFGALTVSKSTSAGTISYGLSPFIAARPLTNAQLIAAKLKATLASTGLAWLLVLIAIPLGLQLSGEMPFVIDRSRRFAETVGTPRAVLFALLVVAAFVASTWKQLVQSLYIGLTGRDWLIKGSVFAMIVLFSFLGPAIDFIVDTHRLGTLWNALPRIFAVFVILKMSAAVWIVVRLHRRRLVSDRVLLTGALLWSAAVFALYAVLVWMWDTPHVPHYLLMLLAILAMPLARLSAAPLAVAWNRHR